MSDARSLPRWKRVFLCVSLLICLFTVNCSLFTVRARANVAEGYRSSEYMVGIPFDITFQVPSLEYLGNSETLYGSLLDVTRFWASDDGTISVNSGSAVTWNSTLDGYPVLLWDVRNVTGSSNTLRLQYVNALNCQVQSFNSDEDFIIDVDDSHVDGFNPGWELGSNVMNCTYNFYVFVPVYDDTLSIIGITQRNIRLPGIERTGWSYVLPYSAFFDAYSAENLPYFVGSDGRRYIWIDSWYCSFDSDSRYLPSYTFSTSQFYSGAGFSYTSYNYYSILRERMSKIIDDNIAMQVNFDDISWTDWLVNSVGAFMDFEIVPNLTFSGIIALLAGMSLFMIFLKVFAGG